MQLTLPIGVFLRMEVLLLCKEGEREGLVTMHVQSLSHWAPANIGPYSQAVKVSGQHPCYSAAIKCFTVYERYDNECRRHLGTPYIDVTQFLVFPEHQLLPTPVMRPVVSGIVLMM